MKKPEVSVIIPTYNREKTIERSINSVLNQTYQNFELLIIDDGSTDRTKEIIQKVKDKRIKYFKQKVNMGANYCRNVGIKKAKGKYVAFQDSDAEWHKNKLKKQIKLIKSSSKEIGAIYTGAFLIKNNRKKYLPFKDKRQKSGFIYDSLTWGNFIDTSTVLIKKQCFKKCGLFDKSLPRLQDWELFLRISKKYAFLFIDEPLVYTYFTKGCISSNEVALINAQKIILQKHFLGKNKKISSKLAQSIGNHLCLNGNLKKGRKYFYLAIKENKKKLTSIILYFLSLCGLKIYKKIIKFLLKTYKKE